LRDAIDHHRTARAHEFAQIDLEPQDEHQEHQTDFRKRGDALGILHEAQTQTRSQD
jgi:hypothetical protein